MCGIALILSGLRIVPPDSHGHSPAPQQHHAEKLLLSVDYLNAVLLRRGPDSLGSKKVFLKFGCTSNAEEDKKLSCSTTESISCTGLDDCHLTSVCSSCGLQSNDISKQQEYSVELHFIGATLQLRGVNPVSQPLIDGTANILIYNGEIFGGLHVDVDKNDGEALLRALEGCHSCNCHLHQKNCDCISEGEICVPVILSALRGPWALTYWQEKSRTLWFGRDAFGRRSLLVHWPTSDEPKFMLSSISPPSEVNTFGCPSSNHSESVRCVDSLDSVGGICYWDELPCGIYSVCLDALKPNSQSAMQNVVGIVRKHEWTDPLLKKLIQWERTHVVLNCKMGAHEHTSVAMKGCHDSSKGDALPTCSIEKLLLDAGDTRPAHKVLMALRRSVMRRTISCSNFQKAGKMESVPVAILFSGGLDSMILAALLDECLNSTYAIDLLNVSFDGVNAPDRISAKAGLKELRRISPSRRWRLVEIDAELSNLTLETKHLMSLINPSKTYMDLNIGIALWLAARGDGFMDAEMGSCHHRYKSTARILLVGSGADEQCAGYGRHRTSYKSGGWIALEEEMKLDMQRIWKRNLGRDDRCISDHGKEARFPFLDEDVIRTLLEMPLCEIANLDEPVGKGDKKILREVAKLLGLEGAAVLPKRAIQFGSRIARESNRQNFGSNRAANQASAGSVVIGTVV